MKEKLLEYILTQVPKSFDKKNWLGFKLTPHSPMIFIKEVTKEGVETNHGNYIWINVSFETIATIYQRFKLNEKLHG